MKVVINKCYGGFGLSKPAMKRYRELGGVATYDGDICRHEEALLLAVEELGEKGASDPLSALRVVEIPDDVEYVVEEYDGQEWIAEKHRTWG